MTAHRHLFYDFTPAGIHSTGVIFNFTGLVKQSSLEVTPTGFKPVTF